jgi:hypothetical protein
MSIDINVYLPEVKPGLGAKITARMAEFGIECETCPGFMVEDETRTGFLPIRFKLISAGPQQYRGKNYLTGFECGLSDFDYGEELEAVQNPPKPNFVQRLLFGQTEEMARQYLANQEMDNLLKNCKKVFEISYHDENQLMLSNLFAVILAEQTNGIYCDPQSGEYMMPQDALADIPTLIAESPKVEWDEFSSWED